MLKDCYGRTISIGDILLNIRSPRDPTDSWSHLICVPSIQSKPEIRDFNAWNIGWDPKETILIGSFLHYPEILKEEGDTIYRILNLLADNG